ncbi:hypothetical protein GCM10011531_11270 [Aquaticitalea lipolytica]|uniref:DUF3575 domain-containing protein n=1 Tax=Aquaticitalea lipolytica TaxID=1247562 RepID=A0A8J2XG80_9FLAO|nr:hypothetical protein [Aquaticitalea lipolytica]GFZ82483.1 hypothetical protein GCM10011531_11270 [Aquaticitalea lipolytica]
MKKILITVLLFTSFISIAQESDDDQTKKHEISSNLFDLVVAGSLNVNYEHLFAKNQSLFLGVTFFDTYGYYDAGYLKSSNAVSLKAAYMIYFSKQKDHEGFYFYPQLKARTGEVVLDDYIYFDYENDVYIEEEYKYDVSGFSAGFGLGHKWLFNNRFTLSINGEIARNLGNFDTDYLDNIEGRFGVNFGYRF